jgi:hypothetical protein
MLAKSGLGVLQDHKLQHVPGQSINRDGRYLLLTTLPGPATLDDFDPAGELRGARNVKRGKDGIILVPQPSDDPKDPLVRLPALN